MLASGIAVFSSAYQFVEHTSQMYFARIQEAVDQSSSSDVPSYGASLAFEVP